MLRSILRYLYKPSPQQFLDAAAFDHMDIVQQYIDYSENNSAALNVATPDGSTALILAAKSKYSFIALSLIATEGVDINAINHKGETALMCAAHSGDTTTLEALLNCKNIEVNARNYCGHNAFITAILSAQTKAVEILIGVKDLDIHAKTPVHEDTSLCLAAKYGFYEIVQLLIATQRIDINAASNKGVTALMRAAKHGHVSVIQLLLTVPDLQINARDGNGDTALIIAARANHIDVVQLLITANGVEINSPDQMNNTILMWAAVCGHTAIVENMIGMPGMDIDAKNKAGNTALIHAASEGRIEVVVALLNAYADATIQNKAGQTAEMLATNSSIQTMLKNHRLSKRLDDFCGIRDHLSKKTDDMQEVTHLSYQSAIRDLQFLQDNLPRIDLSSLNVVVFTLGNLLACLGKDYEKYARSQFECAAIMGHKDAARIVERFPETERLRFFNPLHEQENTQFLSEVNSASFSP